MTDITPYDAVPLDARASEPVRPRLLLVATSLVGAAIAVGYGSLLGFYLSERAAVRATGQAWLPEGVSIPLTQPNFMMLTLAFSVVTMLWAVSAIRADDRANALIAFVLTLVFGFAQLAQTAYLLEIMGMEAAGSEQAVLIYALIGIQLALTGIAMGFVAVTALRTLGGGYSRRDYEGVMSAALFWIVSVGVYTALWYAVYITK
jgi:heme/copper-type cytochrome/quinol oxidase subunit 3